ncbi:hypothetical protein [Burkholderia territorii]|uniref:hypothetical protein n=1 Tax=Burkholderia territorii TaxID=1503055 RepID=UPI00075B8607|nr:hypothetical protein [Burkholderia territorii]KWE25689.1 hypothetical protein WT49_02200 [Burkholderia territorii]KWE39188.1 hypothetical protein WT50_18255 [Burkholderia territorii]KWE52780.1 hypothetical protein WT51_08560 [Burkholderia territorii]
MSESTTNAPLKLVAVVSANDREWLVLNRPLNFIYERSGKDYIGSDGPFRDYLYYEHGGGNFVAFAGRELSLTMSDGTIQRVKDHWWSGSPKCCVSVACGDVESLKRCYVFTGASIELAELAALRATYDGCVYPYRDYEKIISYDDMRRGLLKRLFHEERRRRSLIAAVKSKHRDLIAAREA